MSFLNITRLYNFFRNEEIKDDITNSDETNETEETETNEIKITDSEIKINDLKEELLCIICLDLVKLPCKMKLKFTCSEHKKRTIHEKVYCYNCLINYTKEYSNSLQMCGCRYNAINNNNNIIYCTELWPILDILSDNNIICEKCETNCFTQQLYYKHINKMLKKNDIIKNCTK